MDWIMAGESFGVRFEGAYLRWICWQTGIKAQEGLLAWGKETFDVVPWGDGAPRHMHRPEAEILADLLDGGLISHLKSLVRLSNVVALDVALAGRLAKECPHYDSAMLLAKGTIRPGWEDTIHAFYRHCCTPYDSSLRKGAERLTATLSAHNQLAETMQFIKAHKAEILDCPQTSTALEWFVKLAELDHDRVIRSALAETAARRQE